MEEYDRYRNDASYVRDRKRVDYLHCKLQHIKRAVRQYDEDLERHNLKQEETSWSLI